MGMSKSSKKPRLASELQVQYCLKLLRKLGLADGGKVGSANAEVRHRRRTAPSKDESTCPQVASLPSNEANTAAVKQQSGRLTSNMLTAADISGTPQLVDTS